MNTLSKSVYILLIVLIISCQGVEQKPDVEINRSSFIGKIIITEINEAKENSGGEGGYFEIYFDFHPADTRAAEKYLCTECKDKRVKLFYDYRDTFHSNWIKNWNIKIGNAYPAVRHERANEDNKAAVSYEIFLEPWGRD